MTMNEIVKELAKLPTSHFREVIPSRWAEESRRDCGAFYYLALPYMEQSNKVMVSLYTKMAKLISQEIVDLG